MLFAAAAGGMPEMAFDAAPAAERGVMSKAISNTNTKELKKVTRVRTDFRESWIWADVNTKYENI